MKNILLFLFPVLLLAQKEEYFTVKSDCVTYTNFEPSNQKESYKLYKDTVYRLIDVRNGYVTTCVNSETGYVPEINIVKAKSKNSFFCLDAGADYNSKDENEKKALWNTDLPKGTVIEKYCELVGTARFFSSKITINVDFGEDVNFWRKTSLTKIRDAAGKVTKFNSLVDALNYMGALGWKLVDAFPYSVGNGPKVYYFYFKKEVVTE